VHCALVRERAEYPFPEDRLPDMKSVINGPTSQSGLVSFRYKRRGLAFRTEYVHEHVDLPDILHSINYQGCIHSTTAESTPP
jgi:hypothetical protein